MPTSISPQEFVAKWRQVTGNEKKIAQEHFIDLCHLIGHQTPSEADPKGEWFTFEAGASKTDGGQGWADVFYRGKFAWEYKGKHADLVKAYAQLQQYRESLQNPPLLIVSDIDHIEIHTNFTNSVKRVITITLDDLLTPQGVDQLKTAFENPPAFKSQETAELVTQKAAKEFARLAELLRRYGAESRPERNEVKSKDIAHFLIRILFCLFAEDIGLLPTNLFTRLVKSSVTHPESFQQRVAQLFAAMRSGGAFGADDIKHFNGGLFDDNTALALDSEGMQILAGVCDLDWSSIEPSILGTLFSRSLDPSERAKLGAQYTSKADILLVVEPVLMAPLRRRWEQVKQQAREIASGRSRNKQNALRDLLLGFASELAAIMVLDPACGSGNFLYVALLLLLDLWKEVSVFGSELGLPMLLPDVNPSPSPLQMHGMEINPYAHDLAQTSIWIGYIQWRRDNGFGYPAEPILKSIETIKLMDSILTHDANGKPIEPEWIRADVVVGNPPFLGSRKMRPELSEEYCDALLKVYGNRIEGLPDLVCYWVEKTNNQIKDGKTKRAGLLATQAIRGGTNRQVLDHIKESGDIFFAHSDKEWILDGATVHVSMIGFDNGIEKAKELDGLSVENINSDLTSDIDLSEVVTLAENQNLSFQGVVLRGEFNISREEADKMLRLKDNPNGLPNSDVIKRRRTGEDVVSSPSDSFVVDFGINMSIDEAAKYSAPFEYLKKHVYPSRQKANQVIAREKWWIHWNPRTQMRTALSKLGRYIATPRVAKHRIFVWLESDILPDAQLVVFARDDDYFFGVLQSKVHELWARRLGTQLRDAVSGFRYTSTTTFETFPFPWTPNQEPKKDARVQAIGQAAKELVEQRDRWLNAGETFEVSETSKVLPRTLTNLYNERLTWLALAHRKLDDAVLDAYGWQHDLSDEEILEKLLALNLERVKA